MNHSFKCVGKMTKKNMNCLCFSVEYTSVKGFVPIIIVPRKSVLRILQRLLTGTGAQWNNITILLMTILSTSKGKIFYLIFLFWNQKNCIFMHASMKKKLLQIISFLTICKKLSKLIILKTYECCWIFIDLYKIILNFIANFS